MKRVGVIRKGVNVSGKRVAFEEAMVRQVGTVRCVTLYGLCCVSALLPLNLPSLFSLVFIF